MDRIRNAFILGAGLGTRLRPLTETLPKPLVPVWNRALVAYAFDHLVHDLGVERFAVNTHHCADAYERAFPDATHRGRPLEFRHEPVLLDTAGGIDNLRDWLPRDESFVVYNGDILTDLPLAPALAEHLASGNLVTMLLRSSGDELRVGFDRESGRVVDLRGVLAPEWPHRFQFTGIYFVSPAFLEFLVPGKIESVVLPMLEAIRRGGRVGGYLVDEGVWSDLGEREAYLDSLRLFGSGFPRYGAGVSSRIAASAEIAPDAKVDGLSSLGEGVRIGAGATVRESVLWPGAVVEAGAVLDRVVVREGRTASGLLQNRDL